jgi:hypothetical protein
LHNNNNTRPGSFSSLSFELVLPLFPVPNHSFLAHSPVSEVSYIRLSDHGFRLFKPVIREPIGNDEALGGVDEPTLEFYLHPPAIPDWHQIFSEWLRERQQRMVKRGYYDQISFGTSWAQLFGEWLQSRWSLLHNQGLRDPTMDPSRWIGLFDFWLLTSARQNSALLIPRNPPGRPTDGSTLPTSQTIYARPLMSNLADEDRV